MVRGIEIILQDATARTRGLRPASSAASVQRLVHRHCVRPLGRGPRCRSKCRRTRADPQSDDRRAYTCTTTSALLPPARASTGWTSCPRSRGPRGHLDAGAEHLELPEFLAGYFRRRAEEGEDVRGARPARHLRQGLLGNPAYRLPPPKPTWGDGGRALPGVDALAWAARRRAVCTRSFGGKNPHRIFVVGWHAERDRPQRPTRREPGSACRRCMDIIRR